MPSHNDKPPPRVRARQAIWGDKAEAIEARLKEVDPDLAALITQVAYDNVFDRPGLELKTRELLAITSLLGLGAGADELKTHIHGALRCGATREEIKETILQAAMFVGFPRALAAMKVLATIRPR